MEKRCKICKITYRRMGDRINRNINSKICKIEPYKKTVLEKIDEHIYLVFTYAWDRGSNVWLPTGNTSYFDGEKVIETGIVATRASNDVSEYFELCVVYEGFRHVGVNYDNKDASKELAYISKINGQIAE